MRKKARFAGRPSEGQSDERLDRFVRQLAFRALPAAQLPLARYAIAIAVHLRARTIA